MRIDVTELMNHRVDSVEFDYTFDLKHTDAACVDLPPDVCIQENGIRVKGTVSDTLGCLMFKSHVTVSYKTACARCLEEIEASLEFDMERMILTERISDDSHLSDDDEWDGELDDVIYVNDGRVIPDAEIAEEISLELPSFLLCCEDCPGLCPKCGHKLKEGDCGCKEEKEINPKFAILKKLLDNQE